MRTVLVTGANGFVGRHLCRELVSLGVKVRGVSRSKVSIPGVEMFQVQDGQDGKDKERWARILADVEVVFHLAARVHIMNDKSPDPMADFRLANVEYTRVLAEAAAQSSVKKFLFLSSIHVNGTETFSKPFSANDVPSPVEPYAISKLEAEQFLQAFCKNSNIELLIVRPPLVYGPGCGGNFLRLLKIVQKIPVLPFGGFSNRRSMVFVGNLVDFLIKLSSQTFKNNLSLISDGRDLSFAELIKLLSRFTPGARIILFVPMGLMGFVMRLLGKGEEFHKLGSELLIDSSEVQRHLNWSPKYTVEEGLRQTVDWYLSGEKA